MPRAAFFTLGCKVNQYESFAMMSRFTEAGFELVEPHQPADVYVVNSCTVTATGDKKSRQVLRRLRRQAPDAVLVLCGCFPQAFPEEAALIPEADIVMGSKNRSGVLKAVQQKLAAPQKPRVVDIAPHTVGEPFEPMTTSGAFSRTRALLKIQDGCQRRCSYCIIPDARGPIRSKAPEDLTSELNALGQSGYQEVVLVGINLSCYGLDLGLTLTDALEMAAKTPGIRRVRLGSLEPELLTKEAIARWAALCNQAGEPALCPQFHLSLQSGCNATLARMRRQYTADDYREIVANLRAAFPGCAITTDVMVGFPGESDEEYTDSEAFIREIAFARVHVFVYSKRPGTPAAAMPEQVPAEVSSRRAKAMALAAKDCHLAFLQEKLGTTQPVLWEGKDDIGYWQGHTPCYTLVKAKSEDDLAGEILSARLTEIAGDACLGELT